ncbi:hypothetical protein J2Z32_000027 [Paenibacillus turicensis]|uniref:Uncharacterized protein n=1 Tax=Paenibacillus turicensis TaxID=160487 RepID=A0ABS4FLG0_9BACL|nr:hypothetical protein [Paenibacillus turicensis]MBP1903415.1 hypothetical protein [Paenibacillus turicensis]
MLKLKYIDANNNRDFIINLLEVINKKWSYIYWGIGDVELIPKYHGDYPGTGQKSFNEVAFNFEKKVERERISYLTLSELLEVLEDTQTIRNAVLICFPNEVPFDYNLRPRVEVKELNKIQHELAQLEIRILDGDLFFILSREREIALLVKEQMHEFVLT